MCRKVHDIEGVLIKTRDEAGPADSRVVRPGKEFNQPYLIGCKFLVDSWCASGIISCSELSIFHYFETNSHTT